MRSIARWCAGHRLVVIGLAAGPRRHLPRRARHRQSLAQAPRSTVRPVPPPPACCSGRCRANPVIPNRRVPDEDRNGEQPGRSSTDPDHAGPGVAPGLRSSVTSPYGQPSGKEVSGEQKSRLPRSTSPGRQQHPAAEATQFVRLARARTRQSCRSTSSAPRRVDETNLLVRAPSSACRRPGHPADLLRRRACRAAPLVSTGHSADFGTRVVGMCPTASAWPRSPHSCAFSSASASGSTTRCSS